MTAIDPDLIGIWVIPGTPFTYEVDAAGQYHIGNPEVPIAFSAGGTVMSWGPEILDRQSGSGDTPVGTWIERGTGAEWTFAADGSYTVLWDGVTDTGIWALRQNGTTLWTRELRAALATNGAQVVFTTTSGGTFTYGYTVGAGVWTLFDPVTWSEVARYLDPATLPLTNAASPPPP